MNTNTTTATNYYFNTHLQGTFDEVFAKVEAALKEEGFGVLSNIDVQKKLTEKVEGATLGRYTILGACSPSHAYRAIQAEDKIGTMLPCNVIIREIQNNQFEVAAVNPVASMQAIKNEKLGEVAKTITEKLEKVISSL